MDIQIVEMQSENHPYGDPDQGVPEEAIRMFLEHCTGAQEDSVCMGEHEFIVWRGEDDYTFFANAWTLPEQGEEREYTTYYEFKVGGFAPPEPTTDGLPAVRCSTPFMNE
jgi:hypothetical protein